MRGPGTCCGSHIRLVRLVRYQSISDPSFLYLVPQGTLMGDAGGIPPKAGKAMREIGPVHTCRGHLGPQPWEAGQLTTCTKGPEKPFNQ